MQLCESPALLKVETTTLKSFGERHRMRALNIYQLLRDVFGLLKIMALSILLVATFGCGGGGGSSDDTVVVDEPDCSTETDGCGDEPVDEETTEVSGSAVKGIVIGGTVSAYTIVDGAISTEAVATTSTDSDGNYVLEVPQSDNPLLVAITSNSNTLMVCDAADGCGAFSDNVASSTETDADSDGTIDFGDIYLLNDTDFELSALLDTLGEDGTGSINLTPQTHMAEEFAQQGGGTLDAEGIEAANNRVRELFSLESDILTTAPLDITNLSGDEGSQAALYSALIASFSGLASEKSLSISDIINSVIASMIANNGELVQNSSDDDTIDLGDLFAAAQDCLGAAELDNDELDLSEIAGILAGETEQLKKAADGALTSTTVTAVSDAVTRAKEIVAETKPWTYFILDQSVETNAEIVLAYDNTLNLVNALSELTLTEGGVNNAIAAIINDTMEIALTSRDRAGLLSAGGGNSVLLQSLNNSASSRQSLAVFDVDTTIEMDCSTLIEEMGEVTGTITIDIVNDTLSIECDIDDVSIDLTGSFSFSPSKLNATNIVLSIESAVITNSNYNLTITTGSINAGLASAVDVSDTDQSFSGDNLSSLTVDLDLDFSGMPSDPPSDTEESSAVFGVSVGEVESISIEGNIKMDIARTDEIATSNTTIEGTVSDSLNNSLTGTIELAQTVYTNDDTPKSTNSLFFSGTGEKEGGDSFSGEFSLSTECSTAGLIPLTQSAMNDCMIYLTSFDADLDYTSKNYSAAIDLSVGINEENVEVTFGVETEVEGQPNAQFILTSNSTDISSGIGTLTIYYDINNEAIDHDSISLYVDYNTTAESSTAITITNGAGGTIEFDVPSAAELADIAATISVDDVEQGTISYDELEEQFMAIFSDATSEAASE